MRLIDADKLKESIIVEYKSEYNYKLVNLLIEWIDNQPTADEWINVNDRLPDEEDCYLAYGAEDKGYDILFYDAVKGNWLSMGHILADGEVVYWRPLPELPKEVKQRDYT